jgi:hypothetical protein
MSLHSDQSLTQREDVREQNQLNQIDGVDKRAQKPALDRKSEVQLIFYHYKRFSFS